MPEPHTVRDQLGQHTLPTIRRVAVRLIDRIQHERASDQLAALGVAVIALSEAVGTSPVDVMNVAHNLLADIEGPYTHEIQAIRDFANAELRGRP